MLESLAHIATILGAVGLLFALLTWQGSRKSFHHAVITNCTTRFQKLSSKLGQLPLTTETVQQYLELCNEELFYFESDFLPQPIIDEWLDGMLSFISLRREDDESLFQLPQVSAQPDTDLSPPFSAEQYLLLKNFPRLYYAFRLTLQAEKVIIGVQRKYGPDAARAQMVLTVIDNLHSYKEQPFLKHLHRTRAEAW
ncbi:hypothetical protein [Hymenobacter lucidus]|uniref:Uncharacterized protein n=1 Tax=Hymenobacter lucidus TaxID=2880930 RepID=A0ABS8AZ08_9BACT|nr:hypothetical protein [Hymenobacter lucidus]MCB2411037.1 hypothetical protein [Hymenobacter lucidus]